MAWFLFALLSAFFETAKAIMSKRTIEHIDEFLLAWSSHAFGVLLLLPIMFFVKIPILGEDFWKALIITGILNIAASILFMKAVKHADISLIMPLKSLSPLFMLLSSPLILQEFPIGVGLAGIVLIVMGSYVLEIDVAKDGILAPIKALLRDRGAQYMIGVAIIWSIASNYNKMGVMNSSPLFFAMCFNLFIAIGMFPLLLLLSKNNIKEQYKMTCENLLPLLMIGFFSLATIVASWYAFGGALAIYVVAVKRLSALLSVLFGYFFLKEKHILARLSGAALMVIGVFMLSFSV